MAVFNIKTRYNFNTNAPATLGAKYNDVEIQGIVDLNMAMLVSDVVTIAQRIALETDDRNYLNYNKSEFILFEQNGERQALAIDWIDVNSIQQVSTSDVVLTFPNFDTNNIPVLKQTLASLGTGFNTYSLELK
jgi:hypothetical protein